MFIQKKLKYHKMQRQQRILHITNKSDFNPKRVKNIMYSRKKKKKVNKLLWSSMECSKIQYFLGSGISCLCKAKTLKK